MDNMTTIQELDETALATTFVMEDGSCANCTSLVTDENTKAMIADRETVDATELAVYVRKSIVHVKKTFKLTKPLAIELKRRFDNLDRTKQVDGTYLKIDGAKSLNAWLELYASEIGSKRNFYYIIDEKQAVGTDYLPKPALEKFGYLPNWRSNTKSKSRNASPPLWFANRWFPGAQIGAELEFEWRDKRIYLLEPDGSVVEGFCLLAKSRLSDALQSERRATAGIRATFLCSRQVLEPWRTLEPPAITPPCRSR